MKCTLMNKNKEVMLTEYDSATGVFTKIMMFIILIMLRIF